jgi:hypothetical protein
MSDAMLAAARLYNDPRYFSKSEVRIRNNKIKRQKIVRRQYLTLSFIISIILFVTIFWGSTLMSDAQSDEFVPQYKYYKTITVHTGDTLSSIAHDNFNSEKYNNIDAYLNEIMSINNIVDSSKLNAGESLIIPYYSAEYK